MIVQDSGMAIASLEKDADLDIELCDRFRNAAQERDRKRESPGDESHESVLD
jgi:hypothetical protein